jgi:hypothetical protein
VFGDSIFEHKNICLAAILRQFVQVYGEGVMNQDNVRKCCLLLNGGRTDVDNEARSECIVIITIDLKDKVNCHNSENR